MASNRGSSDLSYSVIEFIRKAGKPSTTLEIAKALGRPRKELAHILYDLQRRGKLLRVQESPPTWQLPQQPTSLGNHSSMNKLRGGVLRTAGRGRGRGRSPTPPSAGYPFDRHMQRGYNFPAPQAGGQIRTSHSSTPNLPSGMC